MSPVNACAWQVRNRRRGEQGSITCRLSIMKCKVIWDEVVVSSSRVYWKSKKYLYIECWILSKWLEHPFCSKTLDSLLFVIGVRIIRLCSGKNFIKHGLSKGRCQIFVCKLVQIIFPHPRSSYFVRSLLHKNIKEPPGATGATKRMTLFSR